MGRLDSLAEIRLSAGLSEDFNAQQMVIARGVSDTLRETPTDSATFPQIARALESMYANAMKSGLEEENYDPLVAILHSTTGEVLYSNKPDVHIPLKPDGIERFTEDGETWYLAYNTDPDMQRTAVIGESGTDRHMLIGDRQPAPPSRCCLFSAPCSHPRLSPPISVCARCVKPPAVSPPVIRQPDTHQHEVSVQ